MAAAAAGAWNFLDILKIAAPVIADLGNKTGNKALKIIGGLATIGGSFANQGSGGQKTDTKEIKPGHPDHPWNEYIPKGKKPQPKPKREHRDPGQKPWETRRKNIANSYNPKNQQMPSASMMTINPKESSLSSALTIDKEKEFGLYLT
jgi:hypothetical protein